MRQAIAYAIDQKAIIDNLFRGLAAPLGQGAPSTDFGFNPDVKPYPYDPARAKALLGEVGYDGEEVLVRSASDYIVNDVAVVNAVTEMLRKVGINARAEIVDIQTRLEMIKSGTLTPTGASGGATSCPASPLRSASCGASTSRASSCSRRA